MQYFTPEGERFVGDCMPFYHEGVFHLYYLLDREHHQSRGGLGEHQWAHASTSDLIHWEHHPLALPITEEWEGSICTGSVFYHDGTFYAFYATRMPDHTQHLCVATSPDGIHFEKSPRNPYASPEKGHAARHYRDPCVFQDPDSGRFHQLVTAALEDYHLRDRGGCLAHLVSTDLVSWEVREPFTIPGFIGAPECPDYFEWNGWYYLVFSNNGIARYRMSRNPFGPWERPKVDAFDGPMARVIKTAAFGTDRRLGAAFLPTLEGGVDDGAWQYAGNAVFREIIQRPDGSLGTKFPEEMVPGCGDSVTPSVEALTSGVTGNLERLQIRAIGGFGVAMLGGIPCDARLRLEVRPVGVPGALGLCVRGNGAYESGYELRLSPHEEMVELRAPLSGTVLTSGRHALFGVERLGEPLNLDLVLLGDIIDVCIDDRRTLVNRCPEHRGDRLFLFCQDGEVVFESIEVSPLA